jgi:mannosylglycerate hydrolase
VGWQVEPDLAGPALEPAPLRVRDAWIHAGVDGAETALRLVDEADAGDLYNFCPSGDAAPAEPAELRVAAPGTVEASLPGVAVTVRFSHRAGEPFLRLDGAVVNERPDHRLRLHIRLPEVSGGAVAGSPFELVDRPLASEGGSLEAASHTWPARGVVLAGGAALLGEGVFEYEIRPEGELAVTLLRCVGTISRPYLTTRPGPAGPDIPTPEAQMIGRTAFAFGLVPRARREERLRAWEAFALPIVEAHAPGGGPGPDQGRLLDVTGAELSSVRRVDGHVEVRVWNPSHQTASARVGGRSVRVSPARIETVGLGG